jgi:hypothetical protein
MIYTCEKCNYQTKRKQNHERHKNRKFVCVNTRNGVQKIVNGEDINPQNNTESAQNNTETPQNNTESAQNNTESAQNNTESAQNNTCCKCSKVCSSSYSLTRHIKICKGVNSLTCSICSESFKYQQAKHRHIKNAKCKPKSKFSPISIIHNTTNNNNTTTNNNTTNNTQNNNININVFGKEDLTYLLQDNDIIQKLKLYGKSGIYGFPKILNDVHFNINKPENNTIIKPDEYGDGVMIKNDDNEWEFREFEDVRDDLIETIVKYFKAYNTVKKKLGIQLVERKERNIIKNFGYELMSLEGTIPKDLFDELQMDEEDIEDSEEEIKNKTRKFDKSTMKTLHNKTNSNFKKSNGDYIIK